MNMLLRLKKGVPLFLITLLTVYPEPSPKAEVAAPRQSREHLDSKKAEGKNALFNPNGGTWELVPSPNTGSPHNYFYGLAAIASNDVWAVGGYGNLTTQAQQLIQHWDGQNWTIATTPTLPTTYNELLAVSAVSANAVWAVGSSGGQALIEHWDGSSWSVVPNPNPGIGNRFFGVAAIASNDVWAVG